MRKQFDNNFSLLWLSLIYNLNWSIRKNNTDNMLNNQLGNDLRGRNITNTLQYSHCCMERGKMYCVTVRGRWIVSGHMFVMILESGTLCSWEEMMVWHYKKKRAAIYFYLPKFGLKQKGYKYGIVFRYKIGTSSYLQVMNILKMTIQRNGNW